MKIAVIAGSSRPKSQSSRVAAYVAQRARAMFPEIELPVIDLTSVPLPLWSGDFAAHPSDMPSSDWKPIAETLEGVDGVAVIVPEYHGMAPPALMNLILQCRYELAHKPGLIIGISASDGGAYPTVQLRGSVTKNNRIVWIPDQVVIRNVKQALLDDKPDPADRVKSRIDYTLTILVSYSRALGSVRGSGLIDHKAFSFGQ